MAGLDHAYLPGDGSSSLRDLWSARSMFGLPKVNALLVTLTIGLAAALMAVDVFIRPPVSVGVLYGFVIFMTAIQGRRNLVIASAVLSMILTVLAFRLAFGGHENGPPLFRCVYGIVLQIVILGVALRGMASAHLIRDQAKLLDETHDSVVVRRLDARLLYWNQGAVDLFGWTFEEARKHSQADLIGSGTTLPPMPIEAFIEHGPWQGEITVFAKNGVRMIMDCRCSLLNDDRGRPFAILTTGNDVTERQGAIDALRQSEIRYRNIFQTTGIGIWECDFSAVKNLMDRMTAEGIVDLREHLLRHPQLVRAAIDATICLDVNHASVSIFGCADRDELLGPVGWVWPPESEGMFRESILAARSGQASFEDEVVLNSRDGRRLRLFLSTAFPPESASRESVFVTVTDIAALAEAQAALRSTQADLAHAVRLTSLGELAASIAHEVNQPIAGMLANGQAGLRWLQRDPPDLPAVELSLNQLIKEANRARSIVGGVRALARNEVPHVELVNLNAIIEETISLLDYELSRSGVTVAKALDRSISDAPAEKVQIQQVIINLLLNGAQAMADTAPGSRAVTVTTAAEQDAVIVTIADSGPGVPSSIREQLFTAFVTTRANGMGLGLSVCASIVKRHGGRIWLEDSATGGAAFSFTIPLSPVEAKL